MENKEFKLNEEYYLADGTKVWARGMDFKGDIFITEQFHVSKEWYVGNHPDRLEWAEFDEDVPGRTYTIEKEYLFSEPPIALKVDAIVELEKVIRNLQKIQRETTDRNTSILKAFETKKEEIAAETLKAQAEFEESKQSKINALKEIDAQILVRQNELNLAQAKEIVSSDGDISKPVRLSIDEYIELFKSDLELNALENSGVDNWGYYGEHLAEFEESNGKSLDDFIDEKRASLLAVMEQSNV